MIDDIRIEESITVNGVEFADISLDMLDDMLVDVTNEMMRLRCIERQLTALIATKAAQHG